MASSDTSPFCCCDRVVWEETNDDRDRTHCLSPTSPQRLEAPSAVSAALVPPERWLLAGKLCQCVLVALRFFSLCIKDVLATESMAQPQEVSHLWALNEPMTCRKRDHSEA